MKLSVVIPNFNGLFLLKKNLNQLIKTLGNSEIIVIDDASTDRSVEFLNKNFPKIKVIQKKTNTGFASTVNLGFKATDSEIVILLNTDTLVKELSIQKILKHFTDPNVFAVGFLDNSIENGNIITRGRGIGKFQKGFLMHSRGEINKTSTLWVSGGSGAFNKNIWEKLGGLDELYNPFYWEDIDICYRALKSGYRIYFDSNIKIEHSHHEGSIKTNYTQKYIKQISYRNQVFFTWKNITDLNYIISHFIWLPIHILQSLAGDGLFLKGFLQALVKLGNIKSSRKAVKRLFVISDIKILNSFIND